MFAAIAAFCVRYVILGLMLSIGLAASVADLRRITAQRVFYLRAMLVLELLVPLLAIGVTSIVPVPHLGKQLILLMAVCPGAPFIPFVTRIKGEAYSPVGLNLLLLSAALAPVSVPAWVWLFHHLYGFELDITPWQVFKNVAPSILLPLLAGIAIGLFLPRFGRVLKPIAHAYVFVSLVIVIGLGLYIGAPTLLKAAVPAFIAVFLIVGGSFFLGAWAARREPAARLATAECAVLGNPALGLAVMAVSYPDFRALPFFAAYIIGRRLCMLPFELSLKRRPPTRDAAPKKNRRTGWPGRRLLPAN